MARLSPDDLVEISKLTARVIADLLKDQRKQILAHVERRFVLAETKVAGSHDAIAINNLHRRITKLESEVRALVRNRGDR
jgi:hypothetical protein